jgi:DNA-binding MarR family transcriptional regulator
MTRQSRPKPAPEVLQAVFDETRLLFHRLRAAAEQVHRQGSMSGGRRGILRDLDRFGPRTVPQMARSRPVSRQHIQTLVNGLAKEGHVEFVDNPAHKRSSLVRLTPRGKDFVDAMNRREQLLLARLKVDVPERDLEAAAAVMRAVRGLFESKQWKRLIERGG